MLNKSKRILALILCILLVTVSLAACRRADKGDGTSSDGFGDVSTVQPDNNGGDASGDAQGDGSVGGTDDAVIDGGSTTATNGKDNKTTGKVSNKTTGKQNANSQNSNVQDDDGEIDMSGDVTPTKKPTGTTAATKKPTGTTTATKQPTGSTAKPGEPIVDQNPDLSTPGKNWIESNNPF